MVSEPRRARIAEAVLGLAVLLGLGLLCSVASVLLFLLGFLITPHSYPLGTDIRAFRPYLDLARLLMSAYPALLAAAVLGGVAVLLRGGERRQATRVVLAVHGLVWLIVLGTYVAGTLAGAFRVPLLSR